MERQLDPTGGAYLTRKMEALGVRVLLQRQTKALLGNGKVQGVEFADGETLDADLVVIAAGIRPSADLGRKAGLEVNRGIVVDDFMVTSDPDILAVGECTEHRGQCFGLVAPLYDQGRVLAHTVTGKPSEGFTACATAAKLKIMGVDIFSAGSMDDTEAGVDVVRYEDPSLGVYKRLLIKDDRLHGVILVGDATDEGDLQRLAEERHRPRSPTPPGSLPAAGRRPRPRSRRHARQRSDLRLQRRPQGRWIA